MFRMCWYDIYYSYLLLGRILVIVLATLPALWLRVLADRGFPGTNLTLGRACASLNLMAFTLSLKSRDLCPDSRHLKRG